LGFVAILLFFLGSCTTDTPSSFHPQGPAAEHISALWWLLFGLAAFVYVIVLGIMLYAFFRSRQDARRNAWFNRNGRYLIIGGGVILPAIILTVIYGFTLTTLNALNAPATAAPLTIEITGHQWWWEVNYPQQDVTTANEIHIPVGEPVTLQLTSDDVIHSFWVPELHGKRDLIPGRTNTFWLQADEPGEYWGLCAELCGVQHAKMLLVVVAKSPADLGDWLERQAQPAVAPAEESAQRGFEVFMEANCDECHIIRGTEASGELGPDLTHFADRLTLGAGAARNSRGSLAGWIVNPHGLKPGNLMPAAADISGEDLQALLAYLETLQ
jgi:cytochrome c oxidase subunit 2